MTCSTGLASPCPHPALLPTFRSRETSLNDPQWGKRGQRRPSELDEICRNVNRRNAELLGRRGNGGDGGNGGDSGPPRRGLARGGAGLLVALVLVVWLAGGLYIVDAGRRGVVTRFGKFMESRSRTALAPAVPRRGGGTGRLLESPDARDRLSQFHGQPERQGSDDADRGREHHQHPVRRPIQPRQRRGIRLQQPPAGRNREVRGGVAIREAGGNSKMDFVLYEGREQIAALTRDLMQQSMDRDKTRVSVEKVTLQNAHRRKRCRRRSTTRSRRRRTACRSSTRARPMRTASRRTHSATAAAAAGGGQRIQHRSDAARRG